MLCLAENADDLRARIERTVIGFDRENRPVRVAQLDVSGAMMVLLQDALLPNLVQTMEGTPAILHGGPFANIAHGCNSVLATKCALHLADWVVTEAGFAFELGAEKFFDIKCRGAGLDTACVVLVATVRALKMHGGRALDELDRSDPDAVRLGLPNLEKHVENIGHFVERPVVAINRFHKDSAEEIEIVRRFCAERQVPCAVASHEGGEGSARAHRERRAHRRPLPPALRPQDLSPTRSAGWRRPCTGRGTSRSPRRRSATRTRSSARATPTSDHRQDAELASDDRSPRHVRALRSRCAACSPAGSRFWSFDRRDPARPACRACPWAARMRLEAVDVGPV